MTHFLDPMHSPAAPMVLDRGPSAADSLTHCSEFHSENESEHSRDMIEAQQVLRSKRLSKSPMSNVDEHVFESLLSTEQAAVLLGGIHPKTLMRWARRPEIRGFQIGRWFFRASQLNHSLLTSDEIRSANMPA